MALNALTSRPRLQSRGIETMNSTTATDASQASVDVCFDLENADTTTETTQLLDEDDTNHSSTQVKSNLEPFDDQKLREKGSSSTKAIVIVFWLSMWFGQNIAMTFLNKQALSVLSLPVTLTFVHMTCNTFGAVLYIHVYRGIERQQLQPGQKQLMIYFSLIFVSNIITGNWSLGLVSISLNQVMRALVPAIVMVLSMLILGKLYSLKRKLSLLPVACGVYLACTGDNSCTLLGFIITLVAILLAAFKAVLSNKFLNGDLKLHPVDLILHQAPLSAIWCLVTMFLSGEVETLLQNREVMPLASFWFLVTGMISFMLNATSFMANKVTSAVTLTVCGNVKQVVVIVMSILINHDVITVQKTIGIAMVSIGGSMYAYISTKETMGVSTLSPRYKNTKMMG